MRRHYLALTALILLFCALRCAGRCWSRAPARMPRAYLQTADAESRLAAGERLPLSAAGIYELELVPGISDELAGRIAAQKAEIKSKAAALPPEKQSRALEIVRGVGPKSCLKLGKFLDPVN